IALLGTIMTADAPRTIARPAADSASAARRNLCFGTRAVRTATVFGRVLTDGTSARRPVDGAVLRVGGAAHCVGVCSGFRDGKVSHADSPREVLGAGVVSNPTISIADCGRRDGSCCKHAATP